MVTLDRLRQDIEKQYNKDVKIKTVEIMGASIEECIADAAVQLETNQKDIEYEVLEKGYKGVIGLMKKPWKIRAYENPNVVHKSKGKSIDELFEQATDVEEVKIVDKDGEFFFHNFGTDLCVKVSLPTGNGKAVTEQALVSGARSANGKDVDEAQLKKLCKKGTDGKYIPIGKYDHVASCDASMIVEIASDEMKATITVTPPGNGGSEISQEMIVSALQKQGVRAGMSEEKICAFVDNPVYNVPYEVATAILPINGRDAYIAYNFETDSTKMRLQEAENGQVDFKELNLIQNVVAGQPLAQKMPAQHGKGGQTILGRYLEAKNGKDIPIPLGMNTKLDRDGVTILAEKNGHVMLVGDKVTVEEVYEVQGVNIKTGNIEHMGTVVVRGNVEDGFNIKASGNIEVYGSVGNCHLEADGDIVISQGIMGRDEGTVKSGKSIWARFIQNATVTSENFVVVNDNIMNSEVTAMHKIIVKGKRASIIGGHLFATEEISAKNIGSASGGIETILEVGIDPKAKKRQTELSEEHNALIKELDEVTKNIESLENIKNVRRSMPKEKEELLESLKEKQLELTDKSEVMVAEMDEIQAHLRELKNIGKVNASGVVYPGTKIYVRDELDDVRNECKAVCFFHENGFVRRGKYDQSQVTTDVEGPEGYSKD